MLTATVAVEDHGAADLTRPRAAIDKEQWKLPKVDIRLSAMKPVAAPASEPPACKPKGKPTTLIVWEGRTMMSSGEWMV